MQPVGAVRRPATRRWLTVLLALSTAPACRDKPIDPVGSGTVLGPDGFQVHSALAAFESDGGLSAVAFWLTDTNTNCADVKGKGFVPYLTGAVTGVVLSFSDDAQLTGTLPIAGLSNAGATYPDGGPRNAAAEVSVKHQDGSFEDALVGTLVIDDVSSDELVGHFGVTVAPDGGVDVPDSGFKDLSGTFDAPVCPGFDFL